MVLTEFKVNMLKINKLLNDLIKDNFTYDYRMDTFNINENLNSYYRNILNHKKDEFITYLKEYSVICCARDININFLTARDETIELECSFVLDKKYAEKDSVEYNCRLTINPLNEGYEINDIALSTKEGITNYGFHLVDLLKKRIRIGKSEGNKITLAISIRNEADQFIRRVLTHAMQYVSNVVILDDASTDNTVEVCEEVLKDFPHKIYINDEPMIQNLKESECKKKLWELTVKDNPDWVLLLDGDEVFEDWATQVLPRIVNDINFDAYYFMMNHMWDDEEHYRVDGYWKRSKYVIYLLRYQPNYEYKWEIKGLHCCRYPNNAVEMPGCCCYVRLKHLGYLTEDIRITKYKKYKLLDPNGIFDLKEHYESFLEKNPVLEKF